MWNAYSVYSKLSVLKYTFVFQPVPLQPLHFLQSLEWAQPLAAPLEEAPVEAPVEVALLVGAQAPVAWTAGSALGRPTACTQTQQTRTSSTTAVGETPTLRTVRLVWSLTAPVLAATGHKAQIIDWLFKASLSVFYICSQSSFSGFKVLKNLRLLYLNLKGKKNKQWNRLRFDFIISFHQSQLHCSLHL